MMKNKNAAGYGNRIRHIFNPRAAPLAKQSGNQYNNYEEPEDDY